jgi:hypothetical protein
VVGTDSVSIRLSTAETRGLGDEEILARFLKGFFGGWSFAPEDLVLSVVGSGAIGVGGTRFEGTLIAFAFDENPEICTDNTTLGIPLKDRSTSIPVSALSRTRLPPLHSRLFSSGLFVILDKHIKSPENAANSYVEVAFGNDQESFAGFHRFDIVRDEEEGVEEAGKTSSPDTTHITLSSSCLVCNPTVNSMGISGLLSVVHKFYGLRLFRDAVNEVLKP